MKDPLIRYARAGYAGLFCCTTEEVRAEAEVKAAAEALGVPSMPGASPPASSTRAAAPCAPAPIRSPP